MKVDFKALPIYPCVHTVIVLAESYIKDEQPDALWSTIDDQHAIALIILTENSKSIEWQPYAQFILAIEAT